MIGSRGIASSGTEVVRRQTIIMISKTTIRKRMDAIVDKIILISSVMPISCGCLSVVVEIVVVVGLLVLVTGKKI